ncbi:GspE/PulE family protein, partial [Treponema sp.]|uniref:GspE/PulE family protein n=1 Tax=Treponema sp. TaxID=166 RepID=UPI00388CF46B
PRVPSSSIPGVSIIITGPTGSGKTTTLHALLGEMDAERLKIITIEDPVEKLLPHIDQIQVNEAIGLTFESVLSKLLRQDPDVIMVGEIRDSATAPLAVRAALTGHLIFSTLHTNDSVSAISRLRNMGVEPYLISSVLRFSLAQRLVRKVCPHCSKSVPLSAEMTALAKKYNLHGETMKESVGCEKCLFTGYKGRTAVSEVFELDGDVTEAIDEMKGDSALYDIFRKKGMKTMQEDAVKKVLSGEITFSEVVREGLA